MTPDRIQTPRTAHLALSPNVTYFAPYSRIVSQEDPENASGDVKAYKLSVVFNTEEAGTVKVECETRYTFGYLGACSTIVEGERYTGPLDHYPALK